MKNKEFCLLFDDDTTFVRGINDLLRNHLREKGFHFDFGMSKNDIPKILERNKNNDLLIAILDLWFINKNKLTMDESEGFAIFDLLREKWPNCYAMFLSGHINADVREKLKKSYNIAIIEKTISTPTILDNLDFLLKEIKQ